MATTGLNDLLQERLRQAAGRVAVVWAPNMSLAVNLTMKLAEIAAAALKDCASGVDVEIIERHHRFKEDAPSGTALQFGSLIAAQMGQTRTSMAARAGPDSGRETRSPTTPCGRATIRASTRSSSDCWVKPWNCELRPPAEMRTQPVPWPRRSSWR